MADNFTYALAPLAAASLWGGMYVVSKWGFSAIPPVTLGFLRVALGAAALLAVVRWRRPPPEFSRADQRRLVALGGVVALTIVTQFVGTDLTNASQGALLTVLTPVFTLLLGVSVLAEPLTRRKVAGMALAAVGTILVVAGQYDLSTMVGASTAGNPAGGSDAGSIAAGAAGSAVGNAVGVTALLAASLAWAGYTVYGKPLVRAYSALETATYSTVAAVPMLGLFAGIELAVTDYALSDLPMTLPVVAAVLYLGLASTAAAWYLWYKGLEYVDAGTVAVFFFVQPLVGTLLGALLLGEVIGPGFVAGGLVMALGVYIVSTSTTS